MAGKIRQLVARPLRVAAWSSGVLAVSATPWAEDFIRTSDNWAFKVIVCLLGGLAVAVAWLAFPKDWLACVEANLITLGRFLLFWVGICALVNWGVYAAHLFIVSSAIWDVLDGKAEVARKERGLPRSKLMRWVGKWLDPLVDKATVLPLLAIFAAHGIVTFWAVGPVIAFDVIGTCLREPVTTFFRLFGYPSSMPWRARLDAEIELSLKKDEEAAANERAKKSESKANAIGKVKALVQDLGLEVCMPFYMGWIAVSRIPDYVYYGAAVLGALSVVSRRLPPNRFLAWSNSFFKHQDVL